MSDAGTTDAGQVDAGSPLDEPVYVLLVDAQKDFPDLISIDQAGLVSALPTTGAAPLSTYWDSVTGVLADETNAYLFLRHSVNGGGSLVRLRPLTGATSVLIPALSFSAWDQAIPLKCSTTSCVRFLLHHRATRAAAVVDFDFNLGADGGWGVAERDVIVGTAPDYAQWFGLEVGLQGGASLIGMYSPGDGGVGALRVHVDGSDAGKFERNGAGLVTSNIGNVGANWAAAVPLGLNTAQVFFSGLDAGSGALVTVQPGAAPTVISSWPAASFGPWSHVVPVAPAGTVGQTLFYTAATGTSMLGWFRASPSPNFVNGPVLPLDGGYEQVVPLPYIP